MTLKERLIKHHQQFAERARGLCVSKARDYAGEDDMLRTLRFCSTVVGVPATTGVVVRMADKVGRIMSLTRLMTRSGPAGAPEVEESIEDTALDLANYAILHQLLVETGEAPCPLEKFTSHLGGLWEEQVRAYEGLLAVAPERALLHGLRRPPEVLNKYAQECLDGVRLLAPNGAPVFGRSVVYTIASRASVVAFAATAIREGRSEV